MDHWRKISTRAHGCIDYGVAGLFAAAAACPLLSPPVRRTLGILSGTHTGYSAITDYEAGVRPWLTMRQHLALDAVGGVALLAAGLAMRRAPSAQRAMLIAAGLMELGIIACSSGATSDSESPSARITTYEPVDTLKPVADGIFVVDSELPGLIGKVLPVRMTVIRLPDGSLLLYSPTRLTENLRQALLRIGPVSHFVAPNIAHWTLLKPWQQAFPEAVTWAAPGLRTRRQVRRSGLRLDHDLSAHAPAAWGDAIELIMVEGGFGFHEAVLFHRASRTLVLTDMVLNLETEKLPALVRPVIRMFGSNAPDGMPPPYLRFVVRRRHQAALAAVRRMLALQPERAIFTHGKYFETDATRRLEHSFRWLLR
jgi:hypothetical protein